MKTLFSVAILAGLVYSSAIMANTFSSVNSEELDSKLAICPTGFWCTKEDKNTEEKTSKATLAFCPTGFWCAKEDKSTEEKTPKVTLACVTWFCEDPGNRA